MSNNQESLQAVRLRGEVCNLTEIHGVRTLKTKAGTDLVTIAEGLHEQLLKFSEIISDLTERVKELEINGVKDSSAPKDGVPGPPGPKCETGPAGDDGRDGLQGPAGPRGPRGKVEQLGDIADIDLNGVQDGCVLVRRGKKWVVELLGEDDE